MPTPKLRRYTLTLTGHKPTPASYNPLSYFRAAPDNDGFIVQFHEGTATDTANPEDTVSEFIDTVNRANHATTETEKSNLMNEARNILIHKHDALAERYNIPVIQPIYYSDSEFETFLETLADKHRDESIFIDIIDKRTDPATTPDAEEQAETQLYYYSSIDGTTLKTDSTKELLKTMANNLHWQSLSDEEQDEIRETEAEARAEKTKTQVKTCLSVTALLGAASVGAYFLGPLCLSAGAAAPLTGAVVESGIDTEFDGAPVDMLPAGWDSLATRAVVNTAIGDVDITAEDGFKVTFNSTEDSFGNQVFFGDLDGDGVDDPVIGAEEAEPLARFKAGTVTAFQGNTSLADSSDPSTAHMAILGKNNLGETRPVAVLDANGDTSDDIVLYSITEPTVTVITGRSDIFTTGDIDLENALGGNGFSITGPSNNFGASVAQLKTSGGETITAISSPIDGKVFVLSGPLSNFSDLTTPQANMLELTAATTIGFGDSLALRENHDGSVSVLVGAPKTDFGQNDSGSVFDFQIPPSAGSWPASIASTDPEAIEFHGELNNQRVGSFVGPGPIDPTWDTLFFSQPQVFTPPGYHHLYRYDRASANQTTAVSTMNLTSWEAVFWQHPSLPIADFIETGRSEIVFGTMGSTGEGRVDVLAENSGSMILSEASVATAGGTSFVGEPGADFGNSIVVTDQPTTSAATPTIMAGGQDSGYVTVINPITIQTDFAVDVGAILEGNGIQPINLGINTLNARSGTATLDITFANTPVGTLSTNNLPAGVTQTPITNGIRLEGSNADILTAATSAIYYTPDNPDWNSELEDDVVFNRVAYDSANPAQTASEAFTLTVTPTVDDPILFPAALSAAFPNDAFEQNQFRSHTVLIDDLVDDPDGVFNSDNFTYNITTPAGLNGYRDTDRLRVEGSATMGGTQTLLFDICRTSPPGYCAQTNVTTYITPVPTTTPAPNTTTTTTTQSPDGPNPDADESLPAEGSGNFLAVVGASGVGGALVLWSALTCLISACTKPRRETLKEENDTARSAHPGATAEICGPLIAAALQDIVSNPNMEAGSAYERNITTLVQELHERDWNVVRIMRILVSLVEDDNVLLEVLRRDGYAQRFVDTIGFAALSADDMKNIGAGFRADAGADESAAARNHTVAQLNNKTPEDLLAYLRNETPHLYEAGEGHRQRTAGELRNNIANAAKKSTHTYWSPLSIASLGGCFGTCYGTPKHAKVSQFAAQFADALDKEFARYNGLSGRHRKINVNHTFASMNNGGSSVGGGNDGTEMDTLNPVHESDPYGSVDSSGGLTDLSTGSTGFGTSGS